MSLWRNTPDDVKAGAKSIDLLFRIRCRQLPVDHAAELAHALLQCAPWLDTIANAGIHSVHVAGSQNGWERPDASDGGWLILSRRTRLCLRIQEQHAQAVLDALTGQSIIVCGETMDISSGSVRTLAVSNTLFARYCNFTAGDDAELADDAGDSEDVFTEHVVKSCEAVGFSPNKILCGRSQLIQTHDRPIQSRSVMIAEIPDRYSRPLQDAGLGHWRLLGCGILIPHKDIAAVNES